MPKFIFVVCTACILCYSNIRATPVLHKKHENNPIQISVNCLQPASNIKPLVGLLLSLNATNPPEEYISKLHPAYWRVSSQGSAVHQRITAEGAKPILILSDFFHYPSEHRDNWNTPKNDVENWKRFVEKTVTDTKLPAVNGVNTPAVGDISGNQNGFIYDIWNEPNGKTFWTDSKEDFFNIFKLAHDKIRSLPGGNNATILGPSTNKFDTAYIHSFLDFCLQNNIILDILAWHEFRPVSELPAMRNDINWVWSNWINTPKYAPLKIKKIFITEFLPKEEQFEPSSLLAYLYYLEKGGATAACKSCWDESKNVSNCWNTSLDGLLNVVNKDFTPRSTWWAYYYYSQSTHNRLESTTNFPSIVPFASVSDSAKELQVLLGYYGAVTYTTPSTLRNVTVNLRSIKSMPLFANRQTVTVSLLEIPNTGEATLNAPIMIKQKTVRLNNIDLSYDIDDLDLRKVYVLKIN